MNLAWCCVTISSFISLRYVYCDSVFSGDSCIQAHNTLRKKHLNTNEVINSKELENAAKQHARRLRHRDTSVPIHPTRSIPRRKRRSLEDGIDESLHLELWDGDISYPSSKDQWLENLNRNSKVKVGRSIHKYCCSRYAPIPHCPKEFFHGLSFPPTAEGVVTDMYNEEEKHYDYGTGKSKSIYSHVNHFARIIWKNTTEVGCGQSLVNNIGCVFTVVLYRIGGGDGTEDDFKENIGHRIVTDDDNATTKIVLVIFIVALIIGIIVLLYCCRHNIDEKYKATMVEIDVLKAEQELETNSTSFWWTRPLKSKESVEDERPSTTTYSVKEKPSIDVVTTNIKPRPSLKNIPRPSLDAAIQPQANVNQLVNRYRGMSMKRQDYVQMNYGANPPVPPSRPPMFNPSASAKEDVQGRRSSGKSAPPPPAPNSVNKPVRPKPPAPINKPPSAAPLVIPSRPTPVTKPLASKQASLSDPPKSVEKPRPAPRKLPAAPSTVTSSGSEAEKDSSGSGGKKPMLPPNRPDLDEDRPLSVSERRKLLEGGM